MTSSRRNAAPASVAAVDAKAQSFRSATHPCNRCRQRVTWRLAQDPDQDIAPQEACPGYPPLHHPLPTQLGGEPPPPHWCLPESNHVDHLPGPPPRRPCRHVAPIGPVSVPSTPVGRATTSHHLSARHQPLSLGRRLHRRKHPHLHPQPIPVNWGDVTPRLPTATGEPTQPTRLSQLSQCQVRGRRC